MDPEVSTHITSYLCFYLVESFLNFEMFPLQNFISNCQLLFCFFLLQTSQSFDNYQIANVVVVPMAKVRHWIKTEPIWRSFIPEPPVEGGGVMYVP